MTDSIGDMKKYCNNCRQVFEKEAFSFHNCKYDQILNTEEFIKIKNTTQACDGPMCIEQRLIATVDYWEKEAFTYQSKAIKAMERILEYKKEIEKLKWHCKNFGIDGTKDIPPGRMM